MRQNLESLIVHPGWKDLMELLQTRHIEPKQETITNGMCGSYEEYLSRTNFLKGVKEAERMAHRRIKELREIEEESEESKIKKRR